MNPRTTSIGLGLCAGLLAATASAQPAPPAAPPAVAASASGDDAAADPGNDVDQVPDTAQLASKVQELEDKLAAMQNRKSQFPIKITGYGDIGLFATQGDGSGFRRDIGHETFPAHSDFGWVFYGDLLATQINSRGDVAANC